MREYVNRKGTVTDRNSGEKDEERNDITPEIGTLLEKGSRRRSKPVRYEKLQKELSE